MGAIKNLKAYKTTTLGILSFLACGYYLFEIENPEFSIFTAMLVFGVLMLFAPDTLIKSVKNFIKNNDDKKI